MPTSGQNGEFLLEPSLDPCGHRDGVDYESGGPVGGNYRGPPQSPPLQPPKSNSNASSRKLLSLFLKCIIMAFFLSLFLLFVGVAALVLLHFLFTTTALHRYRHRRHSSSVAIPFSASNCVEDLQNRLPHLLYSSSIQTTTDCAICLESFRDADSCRSLPACGHLFHMKCVDSWLQKVPNCPICRTRVQLDPAGPGTVNNAEDWRMWWTVGVRS